MRVAGVCAHAKLALPSTHTHTASGPASPTPPAERRATIAASGSSRHALGAATAHSLEHRRALSAGGSLVLVAPLRSAARSPPYARALADMEGAT